jgi:outer membrane protein assembly factor BamB
MNKKIINIFLFTSSLLLTSCSFDKVTGIWSGSKEQVKKIQELEKQQKEKLNSVKIYSSEGIFSKEVLSNKIVKLSKPKKTTSWLMSGLNLQNSLGNISLPNAVNNFLKKKIGKNKFPFSKAMSAPLVFKNNIVLSDDTGTIYRTNLKGKIIWKKNIYVKVYKNIYKNLNLTIYNNNIFVADNIGFIYAINFENGKIVWIKNHGIPLKSNIKISENKLFVINQDSKLICLDIKNGTSVWDVRTISSFIKTQNVMGLAISNNNSLLMLNSSGDLKKINADDGEVQWSLNTTMSSLSDTADLFTSSDVVINGNDIIVSTSSSTFSFNLSNGYLNWENDIGSKNKPIVDNKNVYIVTNNGYFINLERSSGKIIWSINILKDLKRKHQFTEVSGFILGSGKIYAVTSNGYLVICSAASGEVESFKRIGSSIFASPIISNELLFILTSNYKILGYN